MLVSCRIVGPTAYEEYVATLPVGTLGWIAASSTISFDAAWNVVLRVAMHSSL